MSYRLTVLLQTTFLLAFPWYHQAATPQSVADKVLLDIYNSIGNFSTPLPAVELVKGKSFMAAYQPSKNKILLEDEAYAVCRSFGADSLNALAFLLGHELIHSYQKSGWATSYFSYDRYANASHHSEKTADIQGALGARLAGYDNRQIIAPLIDRLYERYALKGRKLEGYPSLEERQATAKIVSATVEDLWNTFQAGNYLMVLEHYQEAIGCYEYLLDYYIGREIYNNLGVAYAELALRFSGKQVDPYRYPFELDPYSRIAVARSDQMNEAERIQRQVYLQEALRYVDQAAEMDPVYPKAFLNGLAIRLLLGEVSTVAQYFDSKMVEASLELMNASEQEQLDAQVLYALLKAEAGQQEQARQLLAVLANSGSPRHQSLARLNLAVLEGRSPERQMAAGCAMADWTATAPGVSLLSYLQEQGRYLDDRQQLEAFWSAESGSVVHVLRGAGAPVVFQRIQTKQLQAPGNLFVGDAQDKLLQQYTGIAYTTYSAGACTFFHFPSCKLVFLVGEKGRLIEWAGYF